MHFQRSKRFEAGPTVGLLYPAIQHTQIHKEMGGTFISREVATLIFGGNAMFWEKVI